jgi:ATP-dependent Lon protease
MEIIKMSGYTIEEKVEIARQHLLPRQLKEHGLTAKHLTIGSNWKKLKGYTASGVTWFRSFKARI